MTNRLLIGVFALFILLSPLVSPSVVFSETGEAETGNVGEPAVLENPLGVSTFYELIQKILQAAFVIGLPIAVLFIVIAGFRFVWARGNSSQLESAKRNLLYTVIGIGVFFGAWTLANVIAITMKALGVGGS